MRLRLRVRSSAAYWAVSFALAVGTGLLVLMTVGRAGQLSARYGPLRTVVLADRDLGAGAVIGPDDVSVREMPGSIVPGNGISQEADAVGRVVVLPAVAGLPLVPGHLAPQGTSGISALLAPGSRAVAVPYGPGSTPVHKGDRVDVLATLDPATAPNLEPTFVVAANALVVDVGESAVTVAVSPDEAKRVAYSTVQGAVTLALIPPGAVAEPPPPPALSG